MTNPSNIEFRGNCKAVLVKSLLAVAPEEGCALLIGKQKNQQIHIAEKWTYQICLIWPCRNIWEPGLRTPKEFPEQIKIQESRRNRFAIDPKDQIRAQKWARSRNLFVLGSAHSHPDNLSIPSKTDIAWTFSPSLMLIVSGKGEVRAWWINNSKFKQGIEIPCKSEHKNMYKSVY